MNNGDSDDRDMNMLSNSKETQKAEVGEHRRQRWENTDNRIEAENTKNSKQSSKHIGKANMDKRTK